MGFAPYEDIVPPIRLSYRGREYALPPVSLTDVPRLEAALEAAEKANAGEEFDESAVMPDDEFDKVLMGDALEQMRADNVPPDLATRAIRVAMADFRNGRDFAEMVWATNGDPVAMERWVRERLPAGAAVQAPAKEPAAP